MGVTVEHGQKWVRLNSVYTVRSVEDGIVEMAAGCHADDCLVTETLQRFKSEVANGRAIRHHPCEACGFPVDPDTARERTLHYQCWFHDATVHQRCTADAARDSGSTLASEALRAEPDARAHLLAVVGDPARTLGDRIAAEALLSRAVPAAELVDAMVRCPSCSEGESFRLNPDSGAVSCHCGEQLKAADAETTFV